MRFPPQFLDDIRARLPVSEVVGKRVALKRAGREWKGLSPFGKEKSPSFFVNDQKGFYHDFSSGKHGDIFTFLMETEGVTFPEAVERLAQLAGVAVPAFSREEVAREEKRKGLHEVMELAAAFFQASLAGRAGAKARGYLADRDLDPATQLRFRLGYAPGDRFALKEHLGGHGVPVEDMVEAGLLIAGDEIPVPYDRFRDRVMFPITDLRGRIIAFGGRALASDVPAKYLNSPETPLFHKGGNLYNGALARQAAHDGAAVIAVEGYVDVIAMVKAGYPATVAPLGTALTEDQLGLLWKMADEPVLCFDGDSAGRKAAYRALDLALPRLKPGKSLRFAQLPDGQDPDDLARSGGREAVAEVLAGASGLADLLWTRETEGSALDTPERRAALEARVLALTGGIADDSVRKYYRQDLEARLRDLFQPQQARGNAGGRTWTPRVAYAGGGAGRPPGRSGSDRFSGGRGGRPMEPPRTLSPRLGASPIMRGFRSAIPTREALILMVVVNHPWLLETDAETFAALDFLNPDADQVRRAILDAVADHDTADAEAVRASIRAAGLEPVLGRLEAAVTHGADWPARPGADPGDVTPFWTQLVALHRRVRTLNKELKDAERALGDDPTDAHLAWLRDVQGRLAAVDGTEALIEGFGLASGHRT